MRCKIDDCDRPARGRGWCSTHWMRWRKHGDPLTVMPPRAGNKRQDHCDVPGCEAPHHAGGYCGSHYARLKQYGDPEAPPRTPTGRPPKTGTPGYDAVHRRLRRTRGPASRHACIACGGPAREWAYQGGDPDELATQPGARREHPGLKYSLDVDRYAPMCTRCHRMKDHSLDHTKARNSDGTWGAA